MAYYPSKIGPVHPGLKIDLLGEMVAACHTADILTPVYITVMWDQLRGRSFLVRYCGSLRHLPGCIWQRQRLTFEVNDGYTQVIVQAVQGHQMVVFES
jgi:hypothetical protein